MLVVIGLLAAIVLVTNLPDHGGDAASIEGAFPVLQEFGVKAMWDSDRRSVGEPCRVLDYGLGAFSTGTDCPRRYRGSSILGPVAADHPAWKDFEIVKDALSGTNERLTSIEIQYSASGSIAFGEFKIGDCPLLVYAPGFETSPGYGDLPYDSVRVESLQGDWYAVFPC